MPSFGAAATALTSAWDDSSTDTMLFTLLTAFMATPTAKPWLWITPTSDPNQDYIGKS